MSELTVEQVEWLDNYLVTIMKPGSAGVNVYRYDTKPYDYAIKIVADWHRLTAEVARLQGVIDTAWDGHGSDVFDILEEGISAILLEKEKGPQR